jgi:hypothetical protein
MLFNEHQTKLWQNMINSIENYHNGKLNYYNFVSELEAAMDAGEFQDEHLVKKWYELWTPLENLRATTGNDVNLEESLNLISKMEFFLHKQIL